MTRDVPGALAVIVPAGVLAVLASWRASSRSGLWAIVGGSVLAILALRGAVVIGWVMTPTFLTGWP